MRFFRVFGASIVSCLAVACGDDTGRGAGGTAGSEEGGGAASDGGAPQGGAAGSGGHASGGGGSAEGGAGGLGGGAGGVADPNVDGPYAVAELSAVVDSRSGDEVPVHAVYPTAGPEQGPYPVVLVAHGFQLPPSQYEGYVRRLATHGFVAVNVDYQASVFGVSNVANAEDLLAALDWTASAPELDGVADPTNAGMTGHSMGGKLALLASSMDDRVKASITLDPVDGSMNCSPQDCPDVSDLMPLAIPTGFLGETVDASGGFMSCAPQADNYQTFYAGTTAPSLEVTVVGANHMSFLDDVASCGFTCSFCNAATTDNPTVNGLAKAFVVAFYRRYLRSEVAYDEFLTGAAAVERYVDTGLATIDAK